MMNIKKVKVVEGLNGWLFLVFDNGERKFVDIRPMMKGTLEKLKSVEFFQKVFIDEELGTITWPGELDLDPDNLYMSGIDSQEIETLYIEKQKQVDDDDWLERA